MMWCKVASVLAVIVNYVTTQHVTFQPQNNPNKNICENINDTTLVERFFSLIFSEFHNTPPVCICVQMCAEQPTYCYPNGCLKKVEMPPQRVEKPQQQQQPQPIVPKPTQVYRIQQNVRMPSPAPMYLPTDDTQTDYVDNNNYYSKTATSEFGHGDGDFFPSSNAAKNLANLNRNPFSDRSIFKNKKTPKVHLRYNLREQVKHKKSDRIKIDKIELSRSKWPISVSDRKIYSIDTQNKRNNMLNNIHNSFIMNEDENGSPYESKYFKRDLRSFMKAKIASSEEEPEPTTTESPKFFLEDLIENLIENNYEQFPNNTKYDINVTVADPVEDTPTVIELFTIPIKRNALEDESSNLINESTKVVNLNNSNENKNENAYSHDTPNPSSYSNMLNEMIKSLSNNIDRNNNSSVDFMERSVGHWIIEAIPEQNISTTVQPVTKIREPPTDFIDYYNTTSVDTSDILTTANDTISSTITPTESLNDNTTSSGTEATTITTTTVTVDNIEVRTEPASVKRDPSRRSIHKKKSHQKLRKIHSKLKSFP